MKRKHIIIALVACVALGFALGLAFDNFVGKAYANEEPANSLTLPEETPIESVAFGSTRSADYEIIYVQGKKYIIFSSGGDIEVWPF